MKYSKVLIKICSRDSWLIFSFPTLLWIISSELYLIQWETPSARLLACYFNLKQSVPYLHGDIPRSLISQDSAGDSQAVLISSLDALCSPPVTVPRTHSLRMELPRFSSANHLKLFLGPYGTSQQPKMVCWGQSREATNIKISVFLFLIISCIKIDIHPALLK